MAENKDIKFDITELGNIEDGKKYKVSIKLPMSMGWFDNMNFVVEDGNNKVFYKLPHKENKDGYVHFEGTVDLKTRAVLRYYFSYLLHGQLKHFKKKDVVLIFFFNL